ncbi:DUF2252 domain-containing protein [Acetobacter conturbans]|uniref:DUF2252 domain-containing protein n=1 Tax=Acetobacter conturbans TaxID=1737472 RepID=A0ABX0JWZ8_9PROT|nr:DUF2252 domain-containing protein [Acetobacter conturbans]NHN87525.1 DUF2252 domain-containing protein [Acetobacter conturbans]
MKRKAAPEVAVSHSETPFLNRVERQKHGVALRKTANRASHADWSPASGRAMPLEQLAGQGATRIPALLPVRYSRMKASPFAFLRGAAIIMANDLANTPTSGLTVQSCGDCHLANFGSYASPEGVPVFDINDFDETLRAPFEWDVKRLGTSLVLAGMENGLSDKNSRLLAERMTQTYAAQMTRLAALSPLEVWADRIDLMAAINNFTDQKVRDRVKAQLQRRMDSADHHFDLVDVSGSVPSLCEHPPLVVRLNAEDDTIRSAFRRYLSTQPPERAILLERYRLQDVIFKVVGVGSVGMFCAIGLFVTADNETLLLQIKEAQTSVLAPFTAPSPLHNQGERVVAGQRMMQAVFDPFLGWTHTSTSPTTAAASPVLTETPEERQFYVRRLKDTRLAAIGSDVAQEGLADYALLCGRTLARAHARTGDVAAIAGYLGKGRGFSDAIASFSAQYARQTRFDWEMFCKNLSPDNTLPEPHSFRKP